MGDCAISGSQRFFMLPSGMAIMCVSEKALEAHKKAELKGVIIHGRSNSNE